MHQARNNIAAAIACLICTLFASCKTIAPIAPTQQRDSIRTQYVHDSIYIRERDSITIRTKADTIFVERWSIRYKDRTHIVHDTITQTTHTTEQVKYIPTYYKRIHLAFWLLVAAIVLLTAARIAWRIYIKR